VSNGKHGGQAGMPRPASGAPVDQGIVHDERGQEQPRGFAWLRGRLT
jgi:hypothetical protein